MKRRLTLVGVVVLGVAVTNHCWALSVEQCISDDGHVYVIVTTSTASIGTQVTSVAMAEGSVSACVQQAGPERSIVSAFAGSLGRPLANRMRTTVLSGFLTNSISCQNNFDAQGAGGMGTLFLPGPPDRTVSADVGSSSENLLPIAEPDPLVPAAMDMPHMRRSRLRCGGDTLAFPMGGSGGSYRISNTAFGEVGDQAITFDDTIGTRVGNTDMSPTQESPDGFLLQGNCTSPSTCQIIVFIGELGSGCGLGASASAAGFAVDGNLATLGPEAAMHAGGVRDCTTYPQTGTLTPFANVPRVWRGLRSSAPPGG